MAFNYQLARYYRSYVDASTIPPSTLPEVAFGGRSNVGKSSLMNALTNNKHLAKVSQTPGKTAAVNFFTMDRCYFVDLPGYGFAQVPLEEKEAWARLVNGYLTQKRRFALIVSLVDIRHPAQKLDIQMVDFLKQEQLPFAVAFTKADKLSKSAAGRQVVELRKGLDLPDEVPTVLTSSLKGDGMHDLRKLIEERVLSA